MRIRNLVSIQLSLINAIGLSIKERLAASHTSCAMPFRALTAGFFLSDIKMPCTLPEHIIASTTRVSVGRIRFVCAWALGTPP
jgi:hypothetical protein